MANGIAIKDVDNKLQELNGEEVIPISTGVNNPEVVEVDTLKGYINEDISTALDNKQDTISDLNTIRSGAALGATAYQKPGTGIPSTDLESGVIPTVPTISTDISSDTTSDTKTTSPKAVKTFVEGKGYTTNIGTITSVKMNGNTVASSGEADLGTVITSETSLSLGSTSGLGNAVTDLSVSGHTITMTKGSTFLTSHQDISGKADKATTLSGYGITDAKIVSGVITLGSDTITPLTSHQDISGKADKSEMSVSTSSDQTTITLKSGTSATVINQHQSLSGYVQTSNIAGLIKNDGTIDTTSYGTYSKPSGGIPASDIASGVIPDVSGKENTSNKVTSLSSSSTDTQYPSAKCVYDLVGDIETLLAAI